MLSLLMALGVALHPIHTTQASLSVEPGQAYARLVIRAFLEDFPPGRDSAFSTNK